MEPAEPNGALQDRLHGVWKPSMVARRQKKFGKRPNTTPQNDVQRTFQSRLAEASAEAPVGSAWVWKLLTLPRVVGGEQQVVARARHSTRPRA